MSMHLLLSQIADVLDCVKPDIDTVVTGTTIDSRNVTAGDMFIALKGEHVDGHDYLAAARQAGAVAAIVSEHQDDELPQLLVSDVVYAFGQLAAFWRSHCKTKCVAVTGSNGKTTVKEMITAILAEQGSVIATIGNLNNALGVPLTLTRIAKECDYAVIEMGTNHPGEIAQLVALVRPDVAVITNVGAAHLEGFVDIDGVATEKASIYDGLKSGGIAVINADMPYATQWKQQCQPNDTVSFALDNDADIKALDLTLEPSSSQFMIKIDNVMHFIKLPLPGKHNVANALAAIAVTNALSVPVEAIVRGLSKMKVVPHRLQLRLAINGARLIDDTYNANPTSYAQALDALRAFNDEHWLVLGDFGELGSDSENIHKQLGLDAKNVGVSRLFTVGTASKQACQAFGDGASHFETQQALQAVLKQELKKGVTCLIKGSHFMRLDKLADALTHVGDH
ncbi:MAG: UDP-N-acetylmuramoyl-tripeptide--D-alanyl-D-alanine ligase [Gammaproteobacteria bacterium]|nr:UDP-N-acetylmuramoyl-tripeptide--D-alanyl-D-alanine ligase [Gammaproteobacteria bacterium]